MNKKSIALSIAIVFLVLILYLLGLRIQVKVGNINNLKMNNVKMNNVKMNNVKMNNVKMNKELENVIIPAPSPEEEIVPPPSYFENLILEKLERNSYLGPYGYVTKDMIEEKNQYPHHNPMMFQKPERIFLNNITE